jgi:diguanylate cyclase (GGDEF)-like protein
MTAGVVGQQVTALRENHDLVSIDDLTGLASRAHLNARLRRVIEQSRRTGDQVGVLLVDLDDFKRVNDVHGHEAGDRLLAAFGDALRHSVRATDVAGRLGADEFAVVLERTTVADAVGVADRILATAAATPVTIDGRAETARASIGFAVAPAADVDPKELMHRADLAMYRAKRRGDHGWERYTEGLEAGPRLAADLRNALAAGQLHVVYQPIVALDTGQLTAVEALVRWDHPTLGPVGPQTFIPVAEETDLIHEIGAWVLEQACRQALAWHARLPAGRRLYLSVNVSPHELRRESLAANVADVLARTGFAAGDLVLEVTEGALAEGETTVRQLTALRGMGVRIALDDFGTGYSSLRYLTRLPIDILKLDRCFVAELDGRPEGAAIAEAVIRLGQIMRLDTIAEGIEEPAQATELAEMGYGTGQGYHFARPLSATDVGSMLDDEAHAGWPPLPGLATTPAA